MRLVRLTIEDFGLIAHAAVDFAGGLTVFSGETGSGKTMLLGALRFALGERADTDMIRGGAARARVVIEVEPDEALREAAAASGIVLAEDDDLIISRELLAGGRSQARINGVAASASQLRALAALVVEIVGQHDAQRLLAPAFALEIVDRFGTGATAAAVSAVAAVYRELHAIDEQLAELQADDGRARARLEFARFALAEIDAAALEDGEDVRLRERRDVLANAEKIAMALGTAGAALGEENGAEDAAGTAASALAGIARFGDAFAQLAASIVTLQAELHDAVSRLAREREAVEADPAELATLLARLEHIDRLKKKYGGSLAEIRTVRADFAALVDRDERRDGDLAALRGRSARLTAQLHDAAGRLSVQRRSAADALEALVAAELAALAMPNARFAVTFEPLERIGATGAERAELQLSANAGEPLRAIAKSASGGELSRVLLALVVAIADRRDRLALVFDEIDAGIGGATAVAVGSRIGRLARGTQVVVVTHLAQIASWADAHLALRKHDVRGATVIELETLGVREARLEEIARMLSGQANLVSLQHAAVLVAGAHVP